MDIRELEKTAADVRIGIIKALHNAGSGHPGGSLSMADIVTVLYFDEMNIDPKDPHMKGRDKCIFSKGHAGPAQLSAMGTVDLLLLPVGGTYTVDSAGAKAVCDAVKPRVVIPMHYRRGDMGFDVLQTAEEFTAQFPPEDVHAYETNTLTVTEELLTQGGVVVLSL